MKTIKNSYLFAFIQGFIERFQSDNGRTHPLDMKWNEYYDSGMNLAERFIK